MTSKWISVPSADGRSFDARLSLPPQGQGPGLILIQEVFGVNGHIQSVADQYAADGFVVLAPDIFWRQDPRVQLGYDSQGFERGLALMGGLDFNLTGSDLQRATQWLRSHEACIGPIASLGFCMGGLLSFLAAARAGVDSAVCYYGGGIHQHLDWADDITCPLLFHFAENDGYIPKSAVEATRAKLSGRENVRIVVHPGVDHGFNCSERPAWHLATALRARGQTLVQLSEGL